MGQRGASAHTFGMKKIGEDYDFVHVLLFKCAQCGCPISSAVTSGAKNIEDVDVRTVKLECHNCDWAGTSAAVAAKRHWVDNWNTGSEERAGQHCES
jgi:Zn-finger protein